MRRALSRRTALRVALAASAGALTWIASSCSEGLPSGPETFASTTLRIVVAHDTIVVGDSSTAQAEARDAAGGLIQGLSFTWASSDPTVVGLAGSSVTSADVTSGRVQRLVGKHTGRSNVTLALPDPRFVASNVSRTETAVVGGVRVLTTRDSGLTAINDTGRAIASGLVRTNGALVPQPSQGSLHWSHLGTHTAVVGAGDTIRYIARSNGTDTLIAAADFCLAGAKCADTVIVRVAQQLSLSLSSRIFRAWSFGDSLGPTVTLADRRGNGLAGTSIRLVPATAADSAIVSVTAPVGINDPSTGRSAASLLVAKGNGTAKVRVLGLAPDGSVAATDSVTEIVRQVARHVAVEPLRATVSTIDSIPIRALARDARGNPIADATVTIDASGLTVNGIWVGPTPLGTVTSLTGTIVPTASGSSLPENNPLAPQIAVITDQAFINTRSVDTVTAGATQRTFNTLVFDSTGAVAAGTWIRFRASAGVTPDSVQVNASGVAVVVWTPRDVAGTYTLTGVRSGSPLSTLTDSAGRIIIRRSVEVKPSDPDASTTTAAISATSIATNGTATVTVVVKDIFGNTVTNATAASFAATTTRGTLSIASCTNGVCTMTYTAPAAAGADDVTIKIGGTDVVNSPLVLTIT
jgi:hypothetical protein